MSFITRFQSSLESLCSLPENSSYVVAYSGGVDSHVLLHCCVKLGLPVRAIHVHHGLQDCADGWVTHCQNVCRDLDIHLDVIYVDANKKKGESPEETARNVRYQALQNCMQTGDCLLTAQHLNDQAETLLLQLFRTASAAGLAAMPESRVIDKGFHLRPFLAFSRGEIEAYADDNKLSWVEDPSNQNTLYDRNFIRKELSPLLKNRWPEIARQLSTVASLQSSNLQVLDDMAAIDMANLIDSSTQKVKTGAYNVTSMLSIGGIKLLSTARRMNMLRHWILTTINLSPTRNLLIEIDKTLLHSEQDANPVIVFSAFEFRKFQNSLYLLKSNKDIKQKKDFDTICWKPDAPLTLPMMNKKLVVKKMDSNGLHKRLLDEILEIRFRAGGERFHPVGRQHSQSLKKLLQQADIPPWDRESIPLLYLNDELIAVVGLWLSQKFAVGAGESGWDISIEDL